MTISLVSSNPFNGFSSQPKPTVVYQAEAAECGLACLCMILQAHGDKRSLRELRQQYGLSMKGATLGDLMSLAREVSLSTRPLRLELSSLGELQTPCILHWDMKHFVVLSKVTRHGIVIHDPAQGKRTLSFEEASKHFTGIALEAWPEPDFEPVKGAPTLKLTTLFQQITGLRRTLLITFTITLVIQCFALLSPYYMQIVVDEALPAGADDYLLALTLGFGLFLCIECVASLLRQHVLLHFTSRLQLLMSARVFAHLLRLPLNWFHSRHTGDIISKFGSLAALRDFVSARFITGIMDGLMATITLVVMFIYAPTLACIVICATLLYATYRIIAYQCERPHHAERLVQGAKEQSHFIESIRAIQTVKQFDQEVHRHGSWLNKLTASLNADIRIGKWQMRNSLAKQFVSGAENLLVIYFGAAMAMENALTVGMLYAFISYKNRFVTAFESLISTALEWRMLSLHLERLSDIVQSEPLTSLPQHINTASSQPPTLTLNDVTFRYDSQSSPVLDNVSLEVAAGEAIAITGKSGSGKSTLLKCITGINAPTHGAITFGGNLVSKGALKGRSAAVYQDDALLSGSVLENISGYTDTPDIKLATAAAQLACIHQEIIAMPMQYQTLVGDMGSTLSGGQVQRIMLARALYQQPDILFLDEASSHLDMGNEAQINNNLKQLRITRIIIAHRPQTIALADRVFELQQGKLHPVAGLATPNLSTSKENHHE